MSQFTQEQLKELEQIYGLKRVGTIKVRDGYISPGDMVWWRCNSGPQHVNSNAENHLANILDHPQVYQISEPIRKTIYVD